MNLKNLQNQKLQRKKEQKTQTLNNAVRLLRGR